MRINPLTYGTDALRMLLYPGRLAAKPAAEHQLGGARRFTLVMFALSSWWPTAAARNQAV